MVPAVSSAVCESNGEHSNHLDFCSCSRRSKCFKCACSATGCTNCSSPLCHFKRAGEENQAVESKRPRQTENDTDSNENRKAIISSMNEDQAKEVLSLMMFDNPSAYDEATCGEDSPASDVPNWCKCRRCKPLETEKMNVCCNHEMCVTKTETFKDLCLKESVIEIAGFVNYCEHFHDTPSLKQNHYRNQSYRFYVLWQYGKLGKGNRVCPPACVVSAIRAKFPSADGNYTGYDSGDGM